jgi:hypothetical protein
MNSGLWIENYDHEAKKWSNREMSVDGLMSREPDAPVYGQPVTKYVPKTTMQPNLYVLKRYISDNDIGRAIFYIHSSKEAAERSRKLDQQFRKLAEEKRLGAKVGVLCLVTSDNGHGGMAWGYEGFEDVCDKSILWCQHWKGVNCRIESWTLFAPKEINRIHMECGPNGSSDFSGLGETPYADALVFGQKNSPGCKASFPYEY